MRRFVCPKCGRVTEAVATEAWCPPIEHLKEVRMELADGPPKTPKRA